MTDVQRDNQFVFDVGALWVERKDRAGRGLIVGSCFSEPGRFGVRYSGIEGLLCTSLAEIESASPESLVWIYGFLQGSMPAAKSDDPDYLREWEAARVEFLHSGNWRLQELGSLYMDDDQDRLKNLLMSSARAHGGASDTDFRSTTERIDSVISALASVEFQSDELSGEHLPNLISTLRDDHDLSAVRVFETVLGELSRACDVAAAAIDALVAAIDVD